MNRTIQPSGAVPALLVTIQFAALGYLALTGPVASARSWLLAVEIAALIPGAWAVFVIRPWNVNVAPTVRAGTRLVTHGPYRWIRHPMYASLFVLTGAWLADAPTPARAAVWGAFVVNMLVKMAVEERGLARRFEEFAEYRRGTRRIIPFVF